jgi:hypothetical protein
VSSSAQRKEAVHDSTRVSSVTRWCSVFLRELRRKTARIMKLWNQPRRQLQITHRSQAHQRNMVQQSVHCQPGSSVSTVSGYGLHDRAIEVRSPAETKDFSSRPALVPTQPPVQWVTGLLSPGLKGGRGVTLTTHIHLVPRSRMSRSYTSCPPKRFRGV